MSPTCYAEYLKATAEQHVLTALETQRQMLRTTGDDVVALALATLQAAEVCPGPKCGIPFEHNGECNCCGKCTLCHALQVAVRPCIASLVGPIFVCTVNPSSSMMVGSRTTVVQRTTTYLIVEKLRPST
jgi:hypothetical protein